MPPINWVTKSVLNRKKKKSNATMTHKLRPTNKKEKGRKNWGNKETLIPDDPSSRTIFELCILL